MNSNHSSPNQFTVQDLIDHLYQKYASREKRGLPFTLIVHAGVADLCGEILVIGQILRDLVDLASREVPNGGDVRLEVYNRRFYKSDSHNFFDVGAGTYVEFLISKIIDPGLRPVQPMCHFQVGNSQTFARLSKSLKNLGGGLIASCDGNGLQYHFVVPGSVESVIEEDSVINESKPKNAVTILVADREEMVLKMVESGLRMKGYSVMAVQDGEEALRKFQKHQQHVDLVFADAALPHVNGETLVRNVSSMKPGTRVILTSAESVEEDHSCLRSIEYSAFIGKPYMLPELFSLIDCLLAAH